MSYEKLRQRMIVEQLQVRGIVDRRVLAAMAEVPRELFVPEEEQAEAYVDGPLSIGSGQTISQPFTVAFMCQALQLLGDEVVLEIGTGSGYGAAVLSHLAGEVHTIECVAELGESARKRLEHLGYNHVHVHVADGTLGLPGEAPLDAIVVTAGGRELPGPYVEQLAEGGRIVIPLGDVRHSQSMYRFTKHQGELITENFGAFAFVPLVGQFGWK